VGDRAKETGGSSQPEFVFLPPPYGDNNDLPSYDEVQRMKLEEENRPPLENSSYSALLGNAMNTSLLSSDELDIGADSTFLLTFLISLMFNWVGFMLTFCVSNSLAGRYGAISGFGLSLVKWTLIMTHDYQNVGGSTAGGTTDPAVSAGGDPAAADYWMNEWVYWLMIVMGMTIFGRGIFMYIRAKQARRSQHQEAVEDETTARFSLFYFN
jgi:hypothetical protein